MRKSPAALVAMFRMSVPPAPRLTSAGSANAGVARQRPVKRPAMANTLNGSSRSDAAVVAHHAGSGKVGSGKVESGKVGAGKVGAGLIFFPSSDARHRYQAAVDRNGAQAWPIAASARGRGWAGNACNRRQPSRTPKSSTGSTSGRPRVKISSISTVQRPTPRIATRRSISVASSNRAASAAVGILPLKRVDRDVPDRGDLAAGQAAGPHRRLLRGKHGKSGWRKGRVAGIQRHEPAQDRLCRTGVELLVTDGVDERLVRLARRHHRGRMARPGRLTPPAPGRQPRDGRGPGSWHDHGGDAARGQHDKDRPGKPRTKAAGCRRIVIAERRPGYTGRLLEGWELVCRQPHTPSCPDLIRVSTGSGAWRRGRFIAAACFKGETGMCGTPWMPGSRPGMTVHGEPTRPDDAVSAYPNLQAIALPGYTPSLQMAHRRRMLGWSCTAMGRSAPPSLDSTPMERTMRHGSPLGRYRRRGGGPQPPDRQPGRDGRGAPAGRRVLRAVPGAALQGHDRGLPDVWPYQLRRGRFRSRR